MPRAKKPTGAELGAAALQRNADILIEPLVTLRYSAEDMEKLDQFAIGLLYDGTGNYSHTSAGLVQRVRDAYLRAEVMLTVRKEIAALESDRGF